MVRHRATLLGPSTQFPAALRITVSGLPARQLSSRSRRLVARHLATARSRWLVTRARNSVPPSIRSAPSLTVFRRELKTVLFRSSFPVNWQAADWSIPASRSKTDDPTVSQCAVDADDTLFRAVLACDHHVLRHLLPDHTSHSYSLRPRRHDCSLTIKADSRNFITRQLFKDMY